MAVSIFDLFKIGIGPSSSHTVGPMRAALLFGELLQRHGQLQHTQRLEVQLYGSLGLTGIGHGSDKGVLLGLMGYRPEDVPIDRIPKLIADVRHTHRLNLMQSHSLAFHEATDLRLHHNLSLPAHPNGMTFCAYDDHHQTLRHKTYLSVGGGFVASTDMDDAPLLTAHQDLPYPYRSGRALLQLCQDHRLSISELTRANERVWRNDAEISQHIANLWQVMQNCVKRGCGIDNPDALGHLAGGLNVPRRAAKMYQRLISANHTPHRQPQMCSPWS